MPSSTEPFAHGDSFIHRIDPRTRLVGAAVLTLPVALCQRLEVALAAFALGMFLTLAARLPFGKLFKRMLAVNLFTLFLWPFLPFSTPGPAVFSVFGLGASLEGIRLAGLITLKTNAIVLSLTALLATVTIRDLGPAMQALKVPDKLCHMLVFTHRYSVLIRQELTLMTQAARARGFHPRTDIHTYRSYAWIAGMLLVRSWDRAERVQDAMHCRGFSGRFHTLAEFRHTPRDTVFLTMLTAIAALFTYLEVIWRIA